MSWHPDIPTEYRDAIVTGDARELSARLPDASVDLVFTDPVYSERSLYDWLAVEARRVLKPGGAVLVWSNGKWHRENTNWLEASGLRYRWDFGCVSSTGGAPMNGRIIAKTNRLIWLEASRSKMFGYLADGFISTYWGSSGGWKWTKNPIFTAQAVIAFSRADAVVFDPFCGEGTTPAIARAQGRRFVAFELDAARAAKARRRVALTQPIAPEFLTEQPDMFDAA